MIHAIIMHSLGRCCLYIVRRDVAPKYELHTFVHIDVLLVFDIILPVFALTVKKKAQTFVDQVLSPPLQYMLPAHLAADPSHSF